MSALMFFPRWRATVVPVARSSDGYARALRDLGLNTVETLAKWSAAICNQEVLSSPEGMNRKHAFDLRGRFAVRPQALWTRGKTLRTGPHTGHKTRPLGVARG